MTLGINGVTKEVICERKGDVLVVKIDDREYQATDVSRTENTLSFFTGRDSHVARVSRASDGIWFSIGGRNFRLTEEKRDSDRPGVSAGNTDGKVEAPMPGNVVTVHVSEGESVSVGAPVVVLESMKMMNEITAATEGIVRRIHCRSGQHVGYGDLLVEITPGEGEK